MAAPILRCVNEALQTLALIFRQRFPQDAPCLATVVGYDHSIITQHHQISLDNLFGGSILWAVPRNRRTVERRWKRKFGSPENGTSKLIKLKTNLLICNTCGHHHEAGVLCPHCYEKVAAETSAMKDAIQTELGLSPVEQEVVVLYDGEKQEQPEEYWKGKRIVEMKKERPAWFSKNLLQQTTQAPSTSEDVKPSQLA